MVVLLLGYTLKATTSYHHDSAPYDYHIHEQNKNIDARISELFQKFSCQHDLLSSYQKGASSEEKIEHHRSIQHLKMTV